jgi:ubiquitin C-terminal hydrolase
VIGKTNNKGVLAFIHKLDAKHKKHTPKCQKKCSSKRQIMCDNLKKSGIFSLGMKHVFKQVQSKL